MISLQRNNVVYISEGKCLNSFSKQRPAYTLWLGGRC